jgi:hypothetical protein
LPSDISHHQQMQAEGMTANLTDAHSSFMVAEVWRLRRVLEGLSRQIYAQAVALTELVWTALEEGLAYHCQRMPGELARLRWVLDAKDAQRLTAGEDWWKECVKPLLQSHSFRDPLVMLRGGDYSAYYRNFPPVKTPDYLADMVKDPAQRMTNLKLIFEKDVAFAKSDDCIGLQIADVLTNALRRGLSGRMQPEGWAKLSKLTIHSRAGSIRLISLGEGEDTIARSYGSVLNRLNAGGRSMLVERRQKSRTPR